MYSKATSAEPPVPYTNRETKASGDFTAAHIAFKTKLLNDVAKALLVTGIYLSLHASTLVLGTCDGEDGLYRCA